MFNAGCLTFREFMVREPLPLATIQNAVLEFLRDRDDAVVLGAQAVNAYVNEPRMAQNIDLLSPCAKELTKELKDYLSQKFHIAVRIRQVSNGRGYRLFQIQKTGNRYLVGVSVAGTLPVTQRIAKVLVMAPAALIASKVISYHQRRGKPKAGTDWRDLAMLLLTFPELKKYSGPVVKCLKAASTDPSVLTVWKELVAQDIEPANEDDEF